MVSNKKEREGDSNGFSGCYGTITLHGNGNGTSTGNRIWNGTDTIGDTGGLVRPVPGPGAM